MAKEHGHLCHAPAVPLEPPASTTRTKSGRSRMVPMPGRSAEVAINAEGKPRSALRRLGLGERTPTQHAGSSGHEGLIVYLSRNTVNQSRRRARSRIRNVADFRIFLVETVNKTLGDINRPRSLRCLINYLLRSLFLGLCCRIIAKWDWLIYCVDGRINKLIKVIIWASLSVNKAIAPRKQRHR